MTQPIPIKTLLKTTTIIFVALVYGLAPLHDPLLDVFHKVEHAVLNTSGNHSHDIAHELDIDHDHKTISFLSDLFSEETNNPEQITVELKLDKHILQKYTLKKTDVSISEKKRFYYLKKNYQVSLYNALPPPEEAFS